MARVEDDVNAALKEFANKYWDQMLKDAETLFSQPRPSPFSKTYLKDLTFRQTAEQRMLQAVYTMAKVKAGVIHPKGENTREEKDELVFALQEARLRLGTDPRDKKRGIDVVADDECPLT